jgi:hypothetical protein
MRRQLFIACIALALIVACLGGFLYVNKCAIERRNGPIHRFPVPSSETFLTDDRAAMVGREVMNLDGFSKSDWKLMNVDGTKAPDGRPDQYLSRNSINPNQGELSFNCPHSSTPQRFVNVELRDGQITAQGSLGK